jgi:ankyrin repeat protein
MFYSGKKWRTFLSFAPFSDRGASQSHRTSRRSGTLKRRHAPAGCPSRDFFRLRNCGPFGALQNLQTGNDGPGQRACTSSTIRLPRGHLVDRTVEGHVGRSHDAGAGARVPRGQVSELLVSKGSSIEARNAKGETPLHIAVRGGDLFVTEMLIKSGAKLEARNTLGATPLHLAVRPALTLDHATLLIDHGANLNVSSGQVLSRYRRAS